MKLELNSDWKMKHEDLHCGADRAPEVLESTDGWMDASLPCDVHMPLIERNLIRDPVLADYSDACRWTEAKSWWFKKEFDIPGDMLGRDALELVCEALDAEADIFFNGAHLGHHRSAFRPFAADVKGLARPMGNTLLVRLTSGVERVSENDLAGIGHCVCTEADAGRGDRGDKRRAFARKPQYCFGWDWCPRVATCGVTGPVYLSAYDTLAVRRLHCAAQSAGDPAEIDVEAEIENFRPFSTVEAALSLRISLRGREVFAETGEYLLKSGLNYIEFRLKIPGPALWWPNGAGAQPLYGAEIFVSSGGEEKDRLATRFGIRTVALDMEKRGEGEYGFAFRVNGVVIFCKGANWIPADSIYARVTDGKYRTLIREAAECNFNMLRVWGGGLYERDAFYGLCDEYGILVWQDFMFACAAYPDALEWFRREVELEMDWQTRRLSDHPCVALWCGNNENAQCFDSWWAGEDGPAYPGGVHCYNKTAPAAVRRNCPELPYWNSSPYGGERPNGDAAGDKHHWGECMMNEDMGKRVAPEEYDKAAAAFVSEYGYPGPCRRESIERYLDGAPPDRGSRLWALHNNAFEKHTVEAGIAKHYGDAAGMCLDEYLLYASLCQGLMLGYSLETLRANDRCSGALYWMYDDCWGETGWTTIDYYLARKPSYYFVKRALAPVKLILRAAGGTARVTAINDTPEPIAFEAEYGYASFDGRTRDTKFRRVALPPFSRCAAFSFGMDGHDTFGGCHFVRPADGGARVRAAVLRTAEFKSLRLPEAAPAISGFARNGDTVRFTVSSDVFAHAVHFSLPPEARLSDEYFDLLPGQAVEITAEGVTGELDARGMRCRCVR